MTLMKRQKEASLQRQINKRKRYFRSEQEFQALLRRNTTQRRCRYRYSRSEEPIDRCQWPGHHAADVMIETRVKSNGNRQKGQYPPRFTSTLHPNPAAGIGTHILSSPSIDANGRVTTPPMS